MYLAGGLHASLETKKDRLRAGPFVSWVRCEELAALQDPGFDRHETAAHHHRRHHESSFFASCLVFKSVVSLACFGPVVKAFEVIPAKHQAP